MFVYIHFVDLILILNIGRPEEKWSEPLCGKGRGMSSLSRPLPSFPSTICPPKRTPVDKDITLTLRMDKHCDKL